MIEFSFYTESFHGNSIPSEEWQSYEARAAEKLALYKRIYTVTAPDDGAEGKAICAMADVLYYFDTAQNGAGGPISGAAIGSVSVSYGANGGAVDLSEKGRARELYRCACMYLDIYRGVC